VITAEYARRITAQLTPTLDACRTLLLDRPSRRKWLKDTSDGRQETVTDLDLMVESRLIEAIQAVEPSATILAEESGHDASCVDAELCFVLDPIDGTDLLIAGDTGYAISVAILSARRVLAGVLDFPARDQRFIAILGGGATLHDRPIRLQGASTLASARVAVSSTQRAMDSLHSLWPQLGVAALVPTPGFTAKLAAILLGDCDAALYLPVQPRTTAIWDYAAGALLLSEAGGLLTALHGEPLLDALPIEHSHGWLAASDDLHPLLQRAVMSALGHAMPNRPPFGL